MESTLVLFLSLVATTAAQGEWQNKGTGSPGPRTGHTLVWDPVNEKLILFSGKITASPSSPPANDLFLWNPADSTWLNPAPLLPPNARAFSQAVWDSELGRMTVHAGEGEFGVPLSDGLAYTPPPTNVWASIAISPPPRKGHAAVYDPETEKMFVFGGTAWGTALSDSYSVDLETSSVIFFSPSMPTALMFHSAVIDVPNHKIYIFGGNTGTAYSSTIYVCDISTPTPSWTTLSASGGPSARSHHSAVWDTKNSRMLVYGGKNGATAFSDLWAFSPAANSWEELTSGGPSPGPRVSASSAWDPEEGVFYLYGGEDGDGMASAELWKYAVSGNGGGNNNKGSNSGGSSRESSGGLCGVAGVGRGPIIPGLCVLVFLVSGFLVILFKRKSARVD